MKTTIFTHTHTKNNEEPNKLIHGLKIVQHLSGGYGQVDLDRCMPFGLATTFLTCNLHLFFLYW